MKNHRIIYVWIETFVDSKYMFTPYKMKLSLSSISLRISVLFALWKVLHINVYLSKFSIGWGGGSHSVVANMSDCDIIVKVE